MIRVPLLLKPKLLAFKNRWRGESLSRGRLGRDMVIGLFALGMVALIYVGTLRSVLKLRETLHLAYLPPSHVLGLVLLMLMGMLFISNAVSALSVLVLGRDLDFVLAAPLSRWKLWSGKFSQILFSSSWMPLLFIAPFVVAFGVAYQAPLAFYVISVVVLIPYFLIPAALATIVVILFTALVPAHRTRGVLAVCGLLLLYALSLLVRMLQFGGDSLASFMQVLRIVSTLSLSTFNWVPSNWVAQCMQQMLEPEPEGRVPEFMLLFGLVLVLMSLTYLCLVVLHPVAYTRMRNLSAARKGAVVTERRLLGYFWKRIPKWSLALTVKEFKLLSRDMAYAVQLLLLLGLAIVYLYNLRIFGAAKDLPPEWHSFLYVMNTAMGAFITTAMSTRFVFPSVPLEGQTFWVLQTSPVDLRDVLRTKFWLWYYPIALVSMTLFGAGSFLISPSLPMALLSSLAALLLSMGIVGLAVGFGAFFGDFHWEHSAEIQASFGSLVFMLFSTLLILASVVPTGVMLYFLSSTGNQYLFSSWERMAWMGGALAYLVLMNLAARQWALAIGGLALEERRL